MVRFGRIMVCLLTVCLLALPLWAGSILEAAEAGKTDAVAKMLKADPALVKTTNDQGRTALHLSAHEGHMEVVKLLVKNGADVNLHEEFYQLTPLHMAVWKGHTEVAEFLLDNGADPKAREKDNETPLYYAATSGNVDTVKFLIDRGANLKDRESAVDNTVLSLAVGQGETEIALFLIEQGADVLYTKENGWTMLHDAAWRGSPEIIALLVDSGIPVDAKTDFGRTPLQNTCMGGNLEGATVLIKKGANVNAEGDEGWTPLYLAINRGNREMVPLLLKAGAKVDQRTGSKEQTPLHLAAIKGYGDVCELLLKKGADPLVADIDGKTPIDYAARYGNKTSLKTLSPNPEKAKKIYQKYGEQCILKNAPPEGEAAACYLGHSGWAVRTANNLLIFDYWKDDKTLPDNPCLANGCICPKQIKGQKVTVFVSHDHGDHYMPAVFDWKKDNPNVTYVMGFEPEDQKDYVYLAPRTTKKMNGMEIMTIESNDSGVGFVVRVDGVEIFHSGDHANRQRDFSGPFKAEIDWLAENGVKPDLFFAPVSGCGFGDQVAVKKGVYYTVEKLTPKAVFPMHAGNNSDRYREFVDEAKKEGVIAAWYPAVNTGDVFQVNTKSLKAAMK